MNAVQKAALKPQLVGEFWEENVPLWRPVYDSGRTMERSARALLCNDPNLVESNYFPGIDLILGPQALSPAFACGILEGNIRQRFIHLVYLHLNASPCWPAQDIPCFPDNLPANAPQDLRELAQNLVVLQGNYPGKTFISSMIDRYPLVGQETLGTPSNCKILFVQPNFFTYRNIACSAFEPGSDALPYRHITLYSRNLKSPDELLELGILDKTANVLNLHGIVFVCGKLSLGGATPLKIRGKGVLVAETITINGSIVKETPDDQCVLYAVNFGSGGSNIVVNTSGRIEAVLIAMNSKGTGNILAQKPLNLLGGIAVDVLNSEQWCTGTHKIFYDQKLKVAQAEFQIVVSPWILFQRELENTL